MTYEMECVVFVFDGKKARVYVNGEDLKLKGVFSYVRYLSPEPIQAWSRLLTVNEVKALYKSGTGRTLGKLRRKSRRAQR